MNAEITMKYGSIKQKVSQLLTVEEGARQWKR